MTEFLYSKLGLVIETLQCCPRRRLASYALRILQVQAASLAYSSRSVLVGYRTTEHILSLGATCVEKIDLVVHIEPD